MDLPTDGKMWLYTFRILENAEAGVQPRFGLFYPQVAGYSKPNCGEIDNNRYSVLAGVVLLIE